MARSLVQLLAQLLQQLIALGKGLMQQVEQLRAAVLFFLFGAVRVFDVGMRC